MNNIFNKSHTYKFNFVDLILLLLCVALIVGCAYIFSPNFNINLFSKKENVKIQYAVEIQSVDEAFIEMIKEENTVIDSVSKNSLGTVVAVDHSTKYSVLDYTRIEDVYSGVMVEHPDKYNLIVTITADGEYESDQGYSVNNRRIAVGERLALKFPGFTCECYCIAISII